MRRSLVLLMAHPDDETFFAAGAIAQCVAQDIQVGVLCATRGERGATGDLCSIDELPAVRECELRDAARALGIERLTLLPYQDQQLAAAPPNDVRQAVVKILRDLRPQTVITFDPEGANQHTDHMAMGRFAADGIAAASDARWYPEEGEPHTVERILWTPPVRVWELGEIPNLRRQAGVDYLLDIRPQRARKEAALRAHRTQWPGLSRLFLGSSSALDWECFRHGGGARPANVPVDAIF